MHSSTAGGLGVSSGPCAHRGGLLPLARPHQPFGRTALSSDLLVSPLWRAPPECNRMEKDWVGVRQTMANKRKGLQPAGGRGGE